MTNDTFSHLKEEIITNNTIDNEVYSRYEVKRGLRNQDGSGVLAGLTRISSVVGARVVDYKSEPVEGILNYRGLSIADFVEQTKSKSPFCFEMAVFLLLVGRMPNDDELHNIAQEIAAGRSLPKEIIDHSIKGIPSTNIMNKLQTGITSLYGFDKDPDSTDPYENFLKSISIIAKFPTIVAYSYLQSQGKSNFVDAPKDMSTAEAFLYMLHEGKEPTHLEKAILDLALVLHAEHGGGNNSSFTTHVVTSSETDIYSSVTASLASLKGPLHGNANKKVMEMMVDIRKHVSDWNNKTEVVKYLEDMLDKKVFDKSGKIYGLGHAVYTKSDPRAVLIKELARDLAEKTNRVDELNLYLTIEVEGPKLFAQKKGVKKLIAPNVDFFSGFVYDSLGIPEDVYTPLFAMGRIAGWCSHRIEEILSGKRIIRPGYKYVSK